ncbi:hypothetical protein CONPUDRAFT_115792 [Coniophora puteana RWD-64-598 SS2]|uniref:N-acetyltransferase domain-containing protein n=1 Tax=Coniophora puteana (strain RWD-64-598) TaxID=741705 RepID=A0A5M3N764_CONPW|nr:uncharacterized protein CONPUDRAFT_115792 [Coniophora puteana RWD-64-598 SS2]EIW86924.1 hypothetical protein CONPUDRAFT_115792 [Coniophora puteana RWD-64-598 SS2]
MRPLQINEKTGEPFLRLPAPHDRIILTPPRESDKVNIVPILNDERVWRWLQGPPVPYLPEHADLWIDGSARECQDVLEELEADTSKPGEPIKLVEMCPARMLREVQEDGSEVYIGDIGIVRSRMDHILDPLERAERIKENEEKELGDLTILWTFHETDYLAPSHHGRGIIPAALGVIRDQWAIPRMGARHIVGYTFAENKASARVFEKCGFVFRGQFDNGTVVRGEKKELNWLEWTYVE